LSVTRINIQRKL